MARVSRAVISLLQLLLLWSVCVLASVVVLCWQLALVIGRRVDRCWNISIAIDQAGGCCLPHSYPDETISARLWREGELGGKRAWHWARRFVDWGARMLGDPDHCRRSYEQELTGAHLPPVVRGRDE